MPISALVITLRHIFLEPGARRARQALLAELTREACLELGPVRGVRVPAVCETATLEEGRALFERLRRMEGVANVDVLSIHFEDEHFEDEHLVSEHLEGGQPVPGGDELESAKNPELGASERWNEERF